MKTKAFSPWENVMRRFIFLAAAAALGASGAFAATGNHFAGSNLLPLTKVSLTQARATALAARPGRITDQALEKEGGGTGLRYSLDIASHGKTFEMGVDR